MSANPLLVPTTELVNYAAVEPAHIGPAIDELLAAARTAVERAADPSLPPAWEAIVEPLEAETERLWRAWAVAGHLNAVVNTPALRESYNEALPKVTEFSTWLGLHEGLYRQYQRLREAPGFAAWTPVRRRIVDLALRDFRLGGVELRGPARDRYAEISEREAQVSQKFSENVLDAVDAWSLHIDDPRRLDGIPADVQEAARQAAAAEGKSGWKLTLKMPCYMPVMQYARDRGLRETLYRAYGTRASEQGDTRYDNSPLIEELLALRAESARLLGFGTYAELSLQTRMARSAAEVQDFLRDLARRARPHAQSDLQQLRDYAKNELGLEDMQSWDVTFTAERLREARYAYSDDEIKQYFTEPRVLAGLFEVIEKLFGVRLQETKVSSWHEDVRGVRVEGTDGTLLGHLYLDLYARSGKQGGAWVDAERHRHRGSGSGTLQTPVAYLTCNFSRPAASADSGAGAKPALLTHDDVITLFHEMGHALHTLLSEVDELGAAAFSSVEWDAIELPSQFMENFCWEWNVVQRLSAHVDTGLPLPRELFDKLRAARNYGSGMATLGQVEYALFDILLHDRGQGAQIGDVLGLLQAVRREVSVLMPPPWHRMPHSFSHLFAGGYGAGYYSYKWAEVLSADAFEAFEEAANLAAEAVVDAIESPGTLDPATGARFRREILAVGGARPAAESFEAFRGRAPRIDALLRHNGMEA
jgi:oligopeptidase A